MTTQILTANDWGTLLFDYGLIIVLLLFHNAFLRRRFHILGNNSHELNSDSQQTSGLPVPAVTFHYNCAICKHFFWLLLIRIHFLDHDLKLQRYHSIGIYFVVWGTAHVQQLQDVERVHPASIDALVRWQWHLVGVNRRRDLQTHTQQWLFQ